jgi:hypothetical protein
MRHITGDSRQQATLLPDTFESNNGEGLMRVEGSCLLANPYLEPVLTSEFGATTDIRQTPGHGHVIATVLLGSARMRHSQRFHGGLRCRNSRHSRPANATSETGKKQSQTST